MIVTIDGNIGAGKTTALRLLAQRGFTVDLEPVEKWEEDLQKIYQENISPFTFQKIVYNDRAANAPRDDNNPEIPVFIERSPLFTKMVFLPVSADKFTADENQELAVLYEDVWMPHKMIYLRSSPQACCEKINIRGRMSEKSMDPKYIERLHDLHEAAANSSEARVHIVNVDGLTPDQVVDQILRVITEH